MRPPSSSSTRWTYLGGITPETAVERLTTMLDVEPERDVLAPGLTFWTWACPAGIVRVEHAEHGPPGLFEIDADPAVLGLDRDAGNVALATWLVDRLPEAFALTDDASYCHPHRPEFVRVTADRLEIVTLSEDPATGEERIDEARTRVLGQR